MKQTPLKRRSGLRRVRPRRQLHPSIPRHERKLAERLRAAFAAGGGPCAICGSVERIQNHHILEVQWLKAACRALGYSAVRTLYALWDLRNRLRACEGCHMAHHGFVEGRRIPRSVVLKHCPEVLAFAAEHGLEHRFDRAYPEEVAA